MVPMWEPALADFDPREFWTRFRVEGLRPHGVEVLVFPLV
jgi:hypothetical protein